MCVWLISLIIMRYSLEMRGSESTKGFLSTFKAVIAHPICVIKYMGKDATFITIASTLKKIVQLYLKKVFGNFCHKSRLGTRLGTRFPYDILGHTRG